MANSLNEVIKKLEQQRIGIERVLAALRDIEGRQAALALDAIAVLRKQRVIALHANSAGIVNRFGPGVVADNTHALAETLGDLEGQRVVIGIDTVGGDRSGGIE